jgi:hypothetical protein
MKGIFNATEFSPEYALDTVRGRAAKQLSDWSTETMDKVLWAVLNKER